ncbi:hypothetical protein ACIRBY_03900 [Streptomyces sp. NPDC096136]|uniref:hypothetical protein n=1 Tax=Streptomyces sp. NPDC096136 TaxID=3366076 RepID=UPI0038175534
MTEVDARGAAGGAGGAGGTTGTGEIRIEKLREALDARSAPTVGVWNRLEGRPRTTDFDRALRVEVRDPLWMLTRQWQLGEFRGEDGGSPVTATYSVAATAPARLRPAGGAVEPLPADRPLEGVVERRPLPLAFGTEALCLDWRLAIGRRWLKLVASSQRVNAVSLNVRRQYIARYPIALPDPEGEADPDLYRVAHPEVWSAFQAVAGRRMDGYAFYQRLKEGRPAYEGITGLLNLHRDELVRLGARLVAWFDALVDQPNQDPARRRPNTAWDPQALEHRFSVHLDAAGGPGGPAEQVLTAPEYPGGTLDWHAFSVAPPAPAGAASAEAAQATAGAAPQVLNRTVFPAPVRYSGMPLPRWWAVEDGRTNFAAVRPDSTDLARLVFLEFALVYSNDWFLLPCDLPAGTLASIRGLMVTDVFGERLWIGPADEHHDEHRGGADHEPAEPRPWAMFCLNPLGRTGDDAMDGSGPGLLLPSAVAKVAEGPVLEEVALIRDEMANMVWGVERTVTLAHGEPRRGGEAAAEVLAHRLRLHPPRPPAAPAAPDAYKAMSSVPENWIPFIPVHVPDQDRDVRLQRAAMPSVIGDDTLVHPRTSLLREGLDAGRQYYVNEEEVPQAGTRLTLAYNRTRGHDGRVALWLSARTHAGRGEASSGLSFDRLTDTRPPGRAPGPAGPAQGG